MTIDDWNEDIEKELDDMFAEGITSFKMYLTYPAMMIGDGAVYHALKALRRRGGIAGVHCENAGVIDARIEELKDEGCGADVSSHPIARPDYCEAEAVARLLRIAQAAESPVVIVHTTNKAALGEIAAAIIELKDGVSCTEAEIQDFCRELPRYKRPRRVIFAKVPRNPTGKIEKPVLRQIYCGGRLVEEQTRA